CARGYRGEWDDVQVRDDLTIETVPLRIDGREVKSCGTKRSHR
ncbi:hypothetical protein A2U01_0077286, partial [Trifolium medium]|nr:hypothetical protein [Trifolium medium]